MFVAQNNASIFGICDIQLRPTLLEEVFMTITKKAELERAQVYSLNRDCELVERFCSQTGFPVAARRSL